MHSAHHQKYQSRGSPNWQQRHCSGTQELRQHMLHELYVAGSQHCGPF